MTMRKRVVSLVTSDSPLLNRTCVMSARNTCSPVGKRAAQLEAAFSSASRGLGCRERLRLAHHPDNSPAILCPARLPGLLADRPPPSVGNDGNATIVDALGHEIVADRVGSPLSERFVRPGLSPLVRVAL